MRKEKLPCAALNRVRIEDPFWSPYLRLVKEEMLPYQRKMLEDAKESHCLENFRIAAGRSKGSFEGWVFQDSDLAKWLEAVAYSLTWAPDPALEALADESIALMAAAQEENGYLNTYFTLNAPGKQFKNLKEGHELYTAGHEIEAAVAYYRATGKDALLNLMRKTADLICEVFHREEYALAVPGHEEIELAMVKLWEVTGEGRYLEMARDFLNRRGSTPNYLSEEHKMPDFVDVWHDKEPYRPDYGQSHLPVREQKTAEGHAVRAMYLYCAMVDVAAATGDETLFAAAERLFENAVTRRMYLTGGIGSSGFGERFTVDFDLPNDRGYAESCASIGLAMLARRLTQVTGDAGYLETMERALMNTVLAGVSLDGKRFFYVNPLEVWPENCLEGTSMAHVKPVRQRWFGCACCPPNIARTLASLGEYAFFTEGNTVYVNLPIGGTVNGVRLTSAFPWSGSLSLEIPDGMRVLLRVPSWLEEPAFTLDGEAGQPRAEQGWTVLENVHSFTLSGKIRPRILYADPRVRQDAGRCAVQYGPLVYCLEEVDNGPNLACLYLDPIAPLETRFVENRVVITGRGKRLVGEESSLYSETPPHFEETALTFTPYAFWGNRGEGEMTVWVKAAF
ncbi:MAG: glycoside hydrolase family 127 protein [bacterium]